MPNICIYGQYFSYITAWCLWNIIRLYDLMKCGSPSSAEFVPYNLLPKSHMVHAFVICSAYRCGVDIHNDWYTFDGIPALCKGKWIHGRIYVNCNLMQLWASVLAAFYDPNFPQCQIPPMLIVWYSLHFLRDYILLSCPSTYIYEII